MTKRPSTHMTPKNTALLGMYTFSAASPDLDHPERIRQSDFRSSKHPYHRKTMHSITSVLPFLIRARTGEDLFFLMMLLKVNISFNLHNM